MCKQLLLPTMWKGCIENGQGTRDLSYKMLLAPQDESRPQGVILEWLP